MNTPRQDSKALRIVEGVAADVALLSVLLRSNEELVIFGLLLLTSAKPSFEMTSLQSVSARLTENQNRLGIALPLKDWNLITIHLLH
jgi:hypothetical protein